MLRYGPSKAVWRLIIWSATSPLNCQKGQVTRYLASNVFGCLRDVFPGQRSLFAHGFTLQAGATATFVLGGVRPQVQQREMELV